MKRAPHARPEVIGGAEAEADLRYQCRLMRRWCRIFRKSDHDWVALAAERYRERHPVIAAPMRIAA